MAGNSFGMLFRITTFGESHGPGIGVVIDGCPPGIEVSVGAINHALARRRPGQSSLTTSRNEADIAVIQSGVQGYISTGAPIALWIENKDARPSDYDQISKVYRPSHADYTYEMKYGARALSGSGRASARETIGRVAAGAIAAGLLADTGISVHAYVNQVHDIRMHKQWSEIDLRAIDSNAVRCPDPETALRMEACILSAKESGDSVGGVIECVCLNVPAGLGEPVFDKLHADLGKALLSINACKGVEFGSGFNAALMKGSEHNDLFDTDADGKTITTTNHSGGIQGGITNGMPIVMRAVFKPPSTIMKSQETLATGGEKVLLEGKGRHDPCVLPRAVPIVEAMAALTLADHLLRMQAMKMH